MKKIDIPDAEPSGRNLDERRHIVLGDAQVAVYEWMPERDGKGKPEQVHLVLDVTPEVALTVRFKSSDAIDRFIATLMRHRNSVWGAG